MTPQMPQNFMRNRLKPRPVDPIRHALPGQQLFPIPNESAAMRVLDRMQGQPGQDQARQAIRTKFPTLPEPVIRPAATMQEGTKPEPDQPGPAGKKKFHYRGMYERTSQDIPEKDYSVQGLR